MEIRTQHTRHAHHGIVERLALFDWTLLFSGLGSVFVGILMIHSTELGTGYGLFWKQLTAAGLGLFGLVVLAILPYQVFRTYTRGLYIIMIVILVAVLAFGVNLRGTRAWFKIGSIYFQVSELARILFVLTMAGYLDQRIHWHSPRALVVPLLLALFPIGLILIEPDFSSSLVFFPMSILMFFFAGARTLHLLAVCSVGGLAAGLPLLSTYLKLLGERKGPVLNFIYAAMMGGWPGLWLFLGVCVFIIIGWWFLREMRVYVPSLYLWMTLIIISLGVLGSVATNKVLKDYQRKRLVAFVNPDLDPLGGGYNVRQSQIAIGSGKVMGKGYGKGTQTRLGFLPSRHTDFIFSVIGEELGFIRAIFVMGFYFLIVWRGFDIATTARDRFGGLVAAGFAAMFGFYALLNIGMTMGLAPVAGVPLPLVSYGGSSVMSSLWAIGLLISIHLRRYLM